MAFTLRYCLQSHGYIWSPSICYKDMSRNMHIVNAENERRDPSMCIHVDVQSLVGKTMNKHR